MKVTFRKVEALGPSEKMQTTLREIYFKIKTG